MYVRTWASVASLAMIGIIYAPSVPAQAATTTVQPAWQDAMVKSTSPASNFGTERAAMVTPKSNAYYAEFNTQIPTGANATGLKLCLTPTQSAPGRLQVFDVPGDPYAWNEGGLNWSTQPAPGVLLATSGSETVAGVRQCVGLPLSARAANDTDLRVVSTSGEISLATAEAVKSARRPALSVTYGTDGTVVPPIDDPVVPPPVPVGFLPFAADGPWNAAIPASPVIDPASAAMVANLSSGGTNSVIANIYSYGARIYEVTADTPRYHIDCTKPWGTCPLESEPGGVPIPNGAMGNPGSDHSMNVIDRARGRAYCFWQYGDNKATTSWGGAYNLNTDGSGTPPSGCTGSGLPGVGGPVRVAEMRAGHIPHALVFATRFCQGPDNGTNFRYPAGTTDGKYFGAGAVPEGARIQLDPTINVDAIPGITAGEKIVARALQTYGAYAGDCGGANMSFTFEEPKGADPYPSLGFAWDYYGMNHIPWNRIRVLRTWNGR